MPLPQRQVTPDSGASAYIRICLRAKSHLALARPETRDSRRHAPNRRETRMLACPTLRTALPLALAAALAGAGHAAEAPAVDRYGDPLPKGALARLGTTRLRHESMVYALAFSPDGKTLATGGQDRDIVFWDVASGKEVR